MLALLTDRLQQDVNGEWEGRTGYGELKRSGCGGRERLLVNLQARLTEVSADHIMEVLAKDEEYISGVANKKLLAVSRSSWPNGRQYSLALMRIKITQSEEKTRPRSNYSPENLISLAGHNIQRLFKVNKIRIKSMPGGIKPSIKTKAWTGGNDRGI